MRGFYKPKGSDGVAKEKSIWTFLDLITKASFPDAPWCRLLRRYGCERDVPQRIAPCPCVWRRPVTGAVAKSGEDSSSRWDWRSGTSERDVRHALQHRLLTPVVRYV